MTTKSALLVLHTQNGKMQERPIPLKFSAPSTSTTVFADTNSSDTSSQVRVTVVTGQAGELVERTLAYPSTHTHGRIHTQKQATPAKKRECSVTSRKLPALILPNLVFFDGMCGKRYF